MNNRKFKKFFAETLTAGQKRLMKKHGSPAEFAVGVFKCVPGEISINEATAAVEKYRLEWNQAK